MRVYIIFYLQIYKATMDLLLLISKIFSGNTKIY